MMNKALLAGVAATSLILPAKAEVYLPPKPAIIKPDSEWEKIKDIDPSLGLLTMGMLPGKGGGVRPTVGTRTTAAATPVAHTVTAGTTLLVAIFQYGGATAAPTGVTGAGGAFTQVTGAAGLAPNRSVYIFYRLNPTAGAQSIAFTTTGSAWATSVTLINLSKTNAAPIGASGAVQLTTAAATTSVTLTVSASNSILLAATNVGLSTGASAAVTWSGTSAATEYTDAALGSTGQASIAGYLLPSAGSHTSTVTHTATYNTRVQGVVEIKGV